MRVPEPNAVDVRVRVRVGAGGLEDVSVSLSPGSGRRVRHGPWREGGAKVRGARPGVTGPSGSSPRGSGGPHPHVLFAILRHPWQMSGTAASPPPPLPRVPAASRRVLLEPRFSIAAPVAGGSLSSGN